MSWTWYGAALNTLADTRYRFIDNDGNSHVLLHREVNGFLTGMGT